MQITFIILSQVNVMCKLSSSGLEAGGEDYRESPKEKCAGVAIASDKHIKDQVVTLGEAVLGSAMFLLASTAASGVCVLHLAKAWLSWLSLNSSVLKLNFFPLKVSPLPSCMSFIFFYFFIFLVPWHA